jgi:hypothetical protein
MGGGRPLIEAFVSRQADLAPNASSHLRLLMMVGDPKDRMSK